MTRARILGVICAAIFLVFPAWFAIGQNPPAFTCPMHPEIRSGAAGTCPRCGMALVPMGPPGAPPFKVALTSSPDKIVAGEPLTLRFAITNPLSGVAVSDLTIVHDMPFHLFIVSDDLSYYDHIHPMPDANGVFVVETSFPMAGRYNLFCDFLPKGAAPQVVHLRLTTEGAPPSPSRPPRLLADTTLVKTVDGVRFSLSLEPDPLAAGKASALIYRLTDERTGLPITDLQPYLGAWGHTLILSDDAERYLHCHPTQMIPPGADRSALSGGPEVAFNATLKQPGVHRLWSQFMRGGKVITVSFTLDVARVDHVASWNGNAWSKPGGPAISGPDGTVRALALRGSELVAGGDFLAAGGEGARGIARWDGKRWRALADGVDGSVRAIAVAGNDLYVGGEFTAAGGVPAQGIARWDGRRWWPLGAGLSGSRDELRPAAVYALAARGKDLFVGGRFISAGGVESNGIARWDGARFHALGSGVRSGDYDGIVWALTFYRGDLYVGGQFLSAGGVAARNIARWNGTAFSPVGGGVAGGLERVSALAATNGRLFVGGDFTLAGEAAARQLAVWDGARWQPADIRTSESVRAIASGDGAIYVAGGSFATSAGVTTTGIVKWDGTGWAALGQGLGSGAFLAPVLAIAPAGRAVYAGGGPFIVR
jgi:hypothetical protein